MAPKAPVAACEDHLARLGEAEPTTDYRLNRRFHATLAEAAGKGGCP